MDPNIQLQTNTGRNRRILYFFLEARPKWGEIFTFLSRALRLQDSWWSGLSDSPCCGHLVIVVIIIIVVIVIVIIIIIVVGVDGGRGGTPKGPIA